MEESILKSTKKVLNIDPTVTVFDTDILMHINSVFFKLNDLGIGPSLGFEIEDDTTTWDAFYTDPRLNAVRTYMYLSVRILFDPPNTGYLMEALKQQIQEYEWRINRYREETAWVDPDPTPPVDEEEILDGGEP